MYRPEDWTELLIKHMTAMRDMVAPKEVTPQQWAEAGADALLEAIQRNVDRCKKELETIHL